MRSESGDVRTTTTTAGLPAAIVRARRSATSSKGMVLYAVLVILAMMSLVVVSLMYAMAAEVAAYDASVSQQQAYMSALSGIHRAIDVLVANRGNPDAWWDDEEMFRDQLVVDDAGGQWYFTVYADNPDDPDTLRYGVMDESARININVNLNVLSRATLLALPNMTEALADSLLDYRDANSNTRSQGAEQDYYDRLAFPYDIRDGDFATLEELLLVKGFDGTIVFGEDINRNGLLDPNENDGDTSFPPDNSDGVLDRGLVGMATAFTVETHRDSNGLPRIDLNSATLALLPPQARQYIQARLDDDNQFEHPSELLNATHNGIQSGIGPQDMDDILDEYTAVFNPFLNNPLSPPPNPVQPTPGLVNVNTAPADVLATINGLDLGLAQDIVAQREQLAPTPRQTSAWLLTSGLVGEQTFKDIAPMLTARSDQYRIRVVGYGLPTGRFCVLEAVVDLSTGAPRIVYLRRLTRLGVPFALTGPESQF